MKRKVIQICTDRYELYGEQVDGMIALCNDGTIWENMFNGKGWNEVDNVPQPCYEEE